MLRPALLLALLVTLPLASLATASKGDGSTYEGEVDRDPAVGEKVALTLRIVPVGALDRTFELQVPSWVTVEGSKVWTVEAQGGDVVERTWNVTATKAGFWRAGLALQDGSTWRQVPGCCLHVWSTQGRGIASPDPDNALPAELAVGFHTSFRSLDAERAELAVRVTPQDKRYAGQQLLFSSPWDADPGTRQRAPSDAPHNFTQTFWLRGTDPVFVTAAAWVEVTFADGPRMQDPAIGLQRVGCARIAIQREAETVRELGRTSCETELPTGESGTKAEIQRPIPAHPPAAVVLLVAALAVGCTTAKAIRGRPPGGRA